MGSNTNLGWEGLIHTILFFFFFGGGGGGGGVCVDFCVWVGVFINVFCLVFILVERIFMWCGAFFI